MATAHNPTPGMPATVPLIKDAVDSATSISDFNLPDVTNVTHDNRTAPAILKPIFLLLGYFSDTAIIDCLKTYGLTTQTDKFSRLDDLAADPNLAKEVISILTGNFGKMRQNAVTKIDQAYDQIDAFYSKFFDDLERNIEATTLNTVMNPDGFSALALHELRQIESTLSKAACTFKSDFSDLVQSIANADYNEQVAPIFRPDICKYTKEEISMFDFLAIFGCRDQTLLQKLRAFDSIEPIELTAPPQNVASIKISLPQPDNSITELSSTLDRTSFIPTFVFGITDSPQNKSHLCPKLVEPCDSLTFIDMSDHKTRNMSYSDYDKWLEKPTFYNRDTYQTTHGLPDNRLSNLFCSNIPFLAKCDPTIESYQPNSNSINFSALQLLHPDIDNLFIHTRTKCIYQVFNHGDRINFHSLFRDALHHCGVKLPNNLSLSNFDIDSEFFQF